MERKRITYAKKGDPEKKPGRRVVRSVLPGAVGILCDKCEWPVGARYVEIQVWQGDNYHKVNYHPRCDVMMHTQPPKGWNDCLKEKR